PGDVAGRAACGMEAAPGQAGPPGRSEPRLGAGEGGDALGDHIDVGRIKLKAEANPPRHRGGNQGCPRAQKWVVDDIAGPAVVEDRPTHALDRLLRPMAPRLLALSVAERVVVGHSPDGALLAVHLSAPSTSTTRVASDNHLDSARSVASST